MNSPLERILGRLLTLAPNRKFAATERLIADVGLIERSNQRALLRANAVFVWSYYLRLIQLWFRRGRDRAYEQVVVVGEENLRSAAAEGKGVLLLSVHLGDFDLGGGWLAERCAITPVACTRPLRPRWRDFLFSATRRRMGIVSRHVHSASIEALEGDLRRNRAVLVMLDRRPHGGGGGVSRILDKPSVAPRGIGLLAARSGAPLVAAATWRGRDGETVVWFGRPSTATGADQAMARISSAAVQLGQLIRAHPEQWHVPSDLREMAWSGGSETTDSTAPLMAAVGRGPHQGVQLQGNEKYGAPLSQLPARTAAELSG